MTQGQKSGTGGPNSPGNPKRLQNAATSTLFEKLFSPVGVKSRVDRSHRINCNQALGHRGGCLDRYPQLVP